MKNIHLIPTDKPSRLWKNNLLQSKLELSKEILIGSNTAQNIYITSDEEIKEGDWVLKFPFNDLVFKALEVKKDEFVEEKKLCKYPYNWCKKIILTDDLDLIKDGIQAIDDDFLEWFISKANDSGKTIDIIEVKHYNNQCRGQCGICDNTCGNWYKIIIPKEDTDYTALLKPVGTTQRQNKNLYSEKEMDDSYDKGFKDAIEKLYSEEEVKDIMAETWIRCVGNDGNNFKEVRDKILKTLKTNNMGNTKQKEKVELLVDSSRINFGYESMQVKLYSEEEVLNIIDDFCSTFKVDLILREDFNQWFEQFKKK